MFSKLFALMLLTASLVGAAQAQNSPRVGRMIFALPASSSYLGVQTEDISKENLAKYGLTTARGVGIAEVAENSPAAKGGLQNGDVIVKFAGEDVTSVRKLTRLIGEVAPEHTTRLTVLRDGGEREVSVTLGRRDTLTMNNGAFGLGDLGDSGNFESVPNLSNTPRMMPNNDGNSAILAVRRIASRQIGISVTPLTAQLAEFFGVAANGGVLINSVAENSPAAKAGLKAGDVVVAVENREIKAASDLIGAIDEKKTGSVNVTFVRNKDRRTVSVVPEAVKPETLQERLKSGVYEKVFDDQSVENADN